MIDQCLKCSLKKIRPAVGVLFREKRLQIALMERELKVIKLLLIMLTVFPFDILKQYLDHFR